MTHGRICVNEEGSRETVVKRRRGKGVRDKRMTTSSQLSFLVVAESESAVVVTDACVFFVTVVVGSWEMKRDRHNKDTRL